MFNSSSRDGARSIGLNRDALRQNVSFLTQERNAIHQNGRHRTQLRHDHGAEHAGKSAPRHHHHHVKHRATQIQITQIRFSISLLIQTHKFFFPPQNR